MDQNDIQNQLRTFFYLGNYSKVMELWSSYSNEDWNDETYGILARTLIASGNKTQTFPIKNPNFKSIFQFYSEFLKIESFVKIPKNIFF